MGMQITFTGNSHDEVLNSIYEYSEKTFGKVEGQATPTAKAANGKNGHTAVAAEAASEEAPKRRGRPPKAAQETPAVAAATVADDEEPTDPFENPETLEEPEAEVSVISASQLKEAIQVVTEITKKKSVAQAQAILEKHGGKKISEVPGKNFPAFLAECKATLAAAV